MVNSRDTFTIKQASNVKDLHMEDVIQIKIISTINMIVKMNVEVKYQNNCVLLFKLILQNVLQLVQLNFVFCTDLMFVQCEYCFLYVVINFIMVITISNNNF